jgi:hypothetical protein
VYGDESAEQEVLEQHWAADFCFWMFACRCAADGSVRKFQQYNFKPGYKHG